MLCACAGTDFTYPQRMVRLSGSESLATRQEHSAAHPSTNQARRRVTSSIKTNTLPLSHCHKQLDVYWTIAIPASVMRLRCANTAEWIKVLLGLETLGDPENVILDHCPDFLHIRCGLHQITLSCLCADGHDVTKLELAMNCACLDCWKQCVGT